MISLQTLSSISYRPTFLLLSLESVLNAETYQHKGEYFLIFFFMLYEFCPLDHKLTSESSLSTIPLFIIIGIDKIKFN